MKNIFIKLRNSCFNKQIHNLFIVAFILSSILVGYHYVSAQDCNEFGEFCRYDPTYFFNDSSPTITSDPTGCTNCNTPLPQTDWSNSIKYCGSDIYVSNNETCPRHTPTLVDEKISAPTNDLKYCEDSNKWIGSRLDCPGGVSTRVPVVYVDTNVVMGYPLVVGGYSAGIYNSNWGVSTGWANSTINYARPDFNAGGIYNSGSSNSNTTNTTNITNIVNATTTTMYQCPNGSLIADYSKCPIEKCSNGALDYPVCQSFAKCTNGATNYSACDVCATGYDWWAPISKCIAKCDGYSERNMTTGSCSYKACTNGAITAPYCSDCPNGKDLWQSKCVDSCPANFARNLNTGTCVELKCTNGTTDFPNCVTCPVSKFLQSDGVCRACDTGTTWNGHSCTINSCANNAVNYPECKLCVAGMDYVISQNKCMYPCPSGYMRNAGTASCDLVPATTCANGAINPSVCTQCNNGYEIYNSYCVVSCVSGYTRNTYGSCAINTTQCWDGSTVAINQNCPPQMRLCDNGVMVSYYTSCPVVTPNPQYQYCSDGSKVILGSVCPVINNPQYKVCNDGMTTVPINSNCPIINNPTPTVQTKTCSNGQVIVYTAICPIINNVSGMHNVNTTHISNVGDKGIVCNGLATIYGGVPSYGWIEWGTDSNKMNNRTPMQYIGRDPAVTFSAPISNLQSSSIYFCRAVMANNSGTYKGDILQTITSDKTITYAPIKKETIVVAKVGKVTTKKVIATTATYECKDSYGNKASVKGGEKMLSLTIDKNTSQYIKGEKVTYTVSYKNTSTVSVKNIEIKVSIPKDIKDIKASKGDIKDGDIIYKIDELGPKGEGVILVEGTVGEVDAARNITVAGVAGYDIPSKEKYRDEVTAINVGTVKGDTAAPTVSSNKTKVSTSNSFLPNTLIEWAILTIIIFACIVGWRAWKAKKEDSHH